MIANTTYYLDPVACSQLATTLGWDEITLIERRHSCTVIMTPTDERTVHRVEHEWVLRVCDSDGPFEYVTVDEGCLFEELGDQYKLHKPEPIPQTLGEQPQTHEAHTGDDGLTKTQRRVLQVLLDRTYSVSARRLAALSELPSTNALHQHLTALRAKGFAIEQNNRRYKLAA